MTENDQTLREHRELIVGLSQVLIELFMRVLALEAVLQASGALSPEETHKMTRQMHKAFSGTRTAAGARAESDSQEAQKQEALERLREILLRFEGTKQ